MCSALSNEKAITPFYAYFLRISVRFLSILASFPEQNLVHVNALSRNSNEVMTHCFPSIIDWVIFRNKRRGKQRESYRGQSERFCSFVDNCQQFWAPIFVLIRISHITFLFAFDVHFVCNISGSNIEERSVKVANLIEF